MFWIPIIIAAAIAAALGTAAAVGVFESAKGKRIVIVGAKDTGKTTWATFLATGEIPPHYVHTKFTITTDSAVKFKDIGLKVVIVDNSGSDASRGDWREQAKKADRIYYFVNASRLNVERYRDRIHKDARVMSTWDEVSAPVTLMITHADSDAGGDAGDYDGIMTRPETVKLRQVFGAAHVVVGDQGTPEGALEFTVDALLPLTR